MMVASKYSRQIERLIQVHREWIQNVSEEIREREAKYLATYLSEQAIESLPSVASTRSLRSVADSLGFLALADGTCGTIAVIDGKLHGLSQVDRSVTCHHWAVKLNAVAHERLPEDNLALDYDAGKCASCLCHAIVNGLDDRIEEQGAILSKMATVPGFVEEGFWKTRYFEPFVLRLLRILRGDAANAQRVDDHDYGVYASILSGWNDDQTLAQALVKACDYHCDHMQDEPYGWDLEFDHPPFDLIPWEIHAVLFVREKLGLRRPVVEHPLLSLMPASLFGRDVRVHDETLAKVEQMYHRHCGD